MTKNTLVLFLLFLFPYLFQSANSKNTSPYFFTQIGVEDGLTQGTVTNIYQYIRFLPSAQVCYWLHSSDA